MDSLENVNDLVNLTLKSVDAFLKSNDMRICRVANEFEIFGTHRRFARRASHMLVPNNPLADASGMYFAVTRSVVTLKRNLKLEAAVVRPVAHVAR